MKPEVVTFDEEYSGEDPAWPSENNANYEIDEVNEKNAKELELEKLVFGDDAAFHAELTAHGLDHFPKQSAEEHGFSQHLPTTSDADQALEDVADEEVRQVRLRQQIAEELTMSAILPRLCTLNYRRLESRHKVRPRRSPKY